MEQVSLKSHQYFIENLHRLKDTIVLLQGSCAVPIT